MNGLIPSGRVGGALSRHFGSRDWGGAGEAGKVTIRQCHRRCQENAANIGDAVCLGYGDATTRCV